MQPYVTTTLLTTLHVSNGTPVPLPTQGNLTSFVNAACAWLSTASKLANVYVDTAVAPTLADVSAKYGVGYDGLAAANQNVPLARVFPAPPASPNADVDFTVPVYGVFRDTDSVAILAARNTGVDPVAVLKDARNTSLPLHIGTELVIPDRTYTTPADPVAPAQPLSLAVFT